MASITIPDGVPFLLISERNGQIDVTSNLKMKVIALGMMAIAQQILLTTTPKPQTEIQIVPGNGQLDAALRRPPTN